MNNVTSLLKKRFKFMFGFSNKVNSKSLEEDYEKHSKRVKDLTVKKRAILEHYGRLLKDKRIKNIDRSSGRTSSSSKGFVP